MDHQHDWLRCDGLSVRCGAHHVGLPSLGFRALVWAGGLALAWLVLG